MRHIIIVATRSELGDLSNFIMCQLTRHFNGWIQEDKGCSFVLCWVNNNLVAETDSFYLLQQWHEKERHYVRALINPRIAKDRGKEDALDEFMSAAWIGVMISSGVIHRCQNTASRYRYCQRKPRAKIF